MIFSAKQIVTGTQSGSGILTGKLTLLDGTEGEFCYMPLSYPQTQSIREMQDQDMSDVEKANIMIGFVVSQVCDEQGNRIFGSINEVSPGIANQILEVITNPSAPLVSDTQQQTGSQPKSSSTG